MQILEFGFLQTLHGSFHTLHCISYAIEWNEADVSSHYTFSWNLVDGTLGSRDLGRFDRRRTLKAVDLFVLVRRESSVEILLDLNDSITCQFNRVHSLVGEAAM